MTGRLNFLQRRRKYCCTAQMKPPLSVLDSWHKRLTERPSIVKIAAEVAALR